MWRKRMPEGSSGTRSKLEISFLACGPSVRSPEARASMALRASLGRRLGLGCASCLTSQPPRLLNPLLGRCYSTRSASSLLDVLIVQPKHARRRTSHLRRHGTTVLTRTPCRSRAVPASGVPYVPVAQGSVRGKPVATVRVPASGMQRLPHTADLPLTVR